MIPSLDLDLRMRPAVTSSAPMVDRLLDVVLRRLVPREVVGGGAFARGKARLLVYIHLLALLGGLGLFGIDVLLHRQMIPETLAFIGGVGVMMYVFRRFGNVVLSGNLLVALVALVLLDNILATGGLYSDSLLWMLLAPVIGFLFTSRQWGVVWSIVLLATLGVLFAVELAAEQTYRYATLEFGPRYYFVSYLGLFSGVLGVLLIFVRNNDETLRQLLLITDELRAQEAQTALQNAKLVAQEGELRRSNRDLELFAYVASHDLKEPLRMVHAYSQLLERKAADKLPDREREYLHFVRDGADRMQVMLDDLLNYSRLGRERDATEDVDLDRTLTLVQHNLRGRLEETGGQISVATDLPTLRGKSTHFVQLFQNLLANGLKFHRPGVAPEVSVEYVREDDGTHVVTVADNGIGMRQEDTSEIFGVFQRLNGRGDFEGSGIGLATVRRILDELGAEIVVRSEVGVGSRFEVRVPSGARASRRDAF